MPWRSPLVTWDTLGLSRRLSWTSQHEPSRPRPRRYRCRWARWGCRPARTLATSAGRTRAVAWSGVTWEARGASRLPCTTSMMARTLRWRPFSTSSLATLWSSALRGTRTLTRSTTTARSWACVRGAALGGARFSTNSRGKTRLAFSTGAVACGRTRTPGTGQLRKGAMAGAWWASILDTALATRARPARTWSSWTTWPISWDALTLASLLARTATRTSRPGI